MNTVKEILTGLSELDIRLEVVDENLDIIIPEDVELPAALIEQIKQNKADLMGYIRSSSGRDLSVIRPLETREYYELSPSQRRLWILTRSDAGSVAYNMPVVYRFKGPLQLAAFHRSFHTIIDRHESLRTLFRTDAEGNVYQFILPPGQSGFGLDVEDLRQTAEPNVFVKELIETGLLKPFDLSTGPLLRATLYQTASDEHLFLFVIHHIISDAWSMEVFVNELLLLYNAYKHGRTSPLSPLSVQYKDYAAWYLDQLNNGKITRQQTYWLDKFKGELPVLELPGQKKRPLIRTYNGDIVYHDFDPTMAGALLTFSKAHGATLFAGLLSAVNILLFRYTGQQDLILGTPVAGREFPELSGQIGFYVNTLALRTTIDPQDNFETLLLRVRKTTFEAFDNQLFPFDQLVEQLNLVRSKSRSPLFDIMVVLQNAGSAQNSRDPIELEGLSVSAWQQEAFTSKFDLTFNFYETTDGFSLGLEYNSDIYTKEFATQLCLHLEQLTAALLAKPAHPMEDIVFLSPAERSLQLETFNPALKADREYTSVARVFEEQAAATPEKIAVIYNLTEWTYRQLNEQSGRFAGYLKNTFAVSNEEPVGVRLKRTEKMMMALLGILKAGAAYVPIDMDYPDDLVQHIVEDSRCRIVVDQSMVDEFMQQPDRYPLLWSPVEQTPAGLAYVIYTSGTTGRPKGVLIMQKSIIRLVRSPDYIDLDPTRTLLVTGSPSFDSVTFEYWGMLLNGGTLILADKTELLRPGGMRQLIERHSVNTMWLTSSWFNEQISIDKNTFDGLSTLLIGGDKLSAPHVNTLLDSVPGITVINGYGPTENTTFSLCHQVKDRQENEIPIGRPISNSTVYILGKKMDLLPIGAVGEIFVGGDGLARGYNGLPALTTEKFIPNPFIPGARLYRTGDLGRWRVDGTVDYMGRLDDQFKLRGYRIEPGEIENTLLNYPGIQQTAVLLQETEGEKQLIAYFVASGTPDIASVRSWLRSQLPAYMAPHYLIQLSALPLTANGKIDRRALPSPRRTDAGTAAVFEGPADELEEQVVTIWSRVLGRDQIGVNDDFFESGGHSLRATRLISLYEKELQASLSLEDLFGNTTIRSQAKLIAAAPTRVFVTIPKAPDQRYYALSSAQKRLFFLHEFAPLSTSYNIPLITYLGKQVDRTRIVATLRKLIHRHEGLRTSFVKIDGQAMQQIHNEATIRLDEHLCRLEDLQTYVETYIRPFQLDLAPLMRTALVEIEGLGFVWIVDVHHIVSDGTSHEVLAGDFLQLYAGEDLPPLRLQYRDFSEWQNHKMQTGELEAQNSYWKEQLSGKIPRTNLPMRNPRPIAFTFEGANYVFTLDAALSQRLKDFYIGNHGTLQIALLSVLHVLYYKYTGQNDLVTGATIAGRRHPDLERIIGIFVNALPIRSYPEEEKTFETFYREMAATCLAAYKNQDVQFEDMVDLVKAPRDPSRNPIFDIALVVQNFERSQANSTLFSDAPLTKEQEDAIGLRATTSKFDLTWFVFEENGNIVINMEYYSAIYDRPTIERMAGHFSQILGIVLNDPGISLADIGLLTPEQEKKIHTVFVKGDIKDYPSDATVHELFREQTIKTPDAFAVLGEGRRLTYLQLEEQANQLSRFLQEDLHVIPAARIGILQTRSSSVIVSILGVLKAGAAYVPLDADYPEDRLLYMLDDAGIEFLLIDRSLIELANKLQWRSTTVKHLVCVDSENIDSETGVASNELMRPELWDHVGDTAVDEISGGGWQSSYTGENLSSLEMREYADNVYAKLKDHLRSDMKVLEIGCSSGITLFGIAGKVGQYCGVDLSAKILANTRQKVEQSGLSNVTLVNLPAHDIHLLEETGFDLVIINSVIHCFNGHNYLRDVLVKAIGKMNDKGWLFLGDVMDEERRAALITDLSAFKEANRDRGYRTKTDWSAELFLSKDYLNDLLSEGLGITAVACSEKLHTIPNELTRYRYDALLRIDRNERAVAPPRKKHRYDLRRITQYPVSPLRLPVAADQLAYMIYTSGSSGKPKGVMVSHRSVINYIYYALHAYAGQARPASFGLFTSLSFDLTVTSIYCPLLSGGFIRIYNPTLEVPDLLKQYFSGGDEPALVKLTPSHIGVLANMNLTGSTVQKAIVGGSELRSAHITTLRMLNADMRIFNEYGPTEATVGCIVWEVTSHYPRILIGKPIFNTAVYILDRKGKLVPEGIIGEICIAGPGLARGYHNLQQLTDEKFVTARYDGERLYQTGDLGRWMEDGSIEFLGRRDAQVKIRGYRIETGEIEEALLTLDGILGVLVLAKEMNDGEQELIAWLVSGEELNLTLIRDLLREKLPEYMIPAWFVRIDSFPLTPNGKINKAALPAPQGQDLTGNTAYVSPVTPIEHALVAIWQKVLGVEHIGIKDNFFALGGHSLKATRLTSLYEKVLHAVVSLRKVFELPTIEEHARLVTGQEAFVYREIRKAEKKPFYPLSSAQKRLYFLNELAPESTGYNMPVVEFLGAGFDAARISRVFDKLIDRHAGLRTSIVKIDGQPFQKVQDKVFFLLDEHECSLAEFQGYLNAYIRPFDPGEAPLMRAALVHVRDIGDVLIVDEHHIISDGVSHELLIREFLQLYEGNELPALRLQYADFSEWQNSLLASGEFDRQKQYWLNLFADGLPRLDLHGDHPRPSAFTFDGDRIGFTVHASTCEALKNLGRSYGGTMQMTLLAILNTLLYKYTGNEDIIIGCGIAGRSHADTEGIYGMFVNSLAIRNRPTGQKRFADFYIEVRSACLSAYENQDVQFDDLVDWLKIERDPSRNPLFDVLLVVQNYERTDTSGRNAIMPSGEEQSFTDWESILFTNRTAKFDLTFHVWENDQDMYISIEYYTAIFGRAYIQRLIGHFNEAIRAVLKDPDVLIGDLTILGVQEKELILRDFVYGPTLYLPETDTIHDRFSKQSDLTPHHIAVIDLSGPLTYIDLQKRSNQLGNFLSSTIHLQPEARVALLQDRNAGLIISILGILKAGGAYLPLDISFPEERLLYMLEDSGAEVLITSKQLVDLANRLQWRSKGLQYIICIDSDDYYRERGGVYNQLMQKDLWDHVGDTAVDAITAGGWLSSYTGRPISDEEMAEYSINAFLKLQPHLHSNMKVLEIGCSSGLTMFRVAPLVKNYYGTDLSSTILERTRKEAEALGQTNIFLSCMPAHAIESLGEQEFDLVIVNSVIQCFEGHNYLRDVLIKAIGLLKNKGALFLGDLMDEDRRDDLIKSLRGFRAGHIGEKDLKTKTDWSAELFLSKEYLNDLVREDIGITRAAFSDKIYSIPNELTLFRYDAYLTVDKDQPAAGQQKNRFQFDLREIAACHDTPPSVRVSRHDLCYVMYTSGSTGQPKGAMIGHSGVLRLVSDPSWVQLTEGSCLLATGSPSFDATTFEFWGMLLNGGRLVLLPQGSLLDPQLLKQQIKANGVNIMWFTAGWLNELIDNDSSIFSSLRYILAGGDKLSGRHIARLLQHYPGLQIINGYGPTENTTFSLTHHITAVNGENIPIGRPITNSSAWILDKQDDLVPIGVVGEIALGGDGLARSYLNNDQLTREKFISNPYDPGTRLYRSGDLGKWLPDGTIEFIGRKDNQVKIRGYRIEPGEIENCLLSKEYIDNAVVIVPPGNEQKILAFVVLSGLLTDTRIIAADLAESLPAYMVPDRFIVMDHFPLTDNGKVNRKALLLADKEGLDETSGYAVPVNPLEKQLAAIWTDLLGRENIGIHDDFFQSGGHSLKAISLVGAYHEKFGIRIPLKDIFDKTTILEHAVLIGRAAAQEKQGVALIPLNTIREEKTNMILIPAISGNSIQFRGFAETIGEEFNCYGLDYPGIDLIETPRNSITDMAYEFSNAIDSSNFHRERPLLILGYSMGGIIAFEVCREMERKGYQCRLILVDRPVVDRVGVLEDFSTEEIDGYLDLLIRSFYGDTAGSDAQDDMKRYLRHNLRILDNQLTTGIISSDIISIDAITKEQPDKMTGWSKYTSGHHKVYPIDADHYELFLSKNRARLKTILYSALRLETAQV